VVVLVVVVRVAQQKKKKVKGRILGGHTEERERDLVAMQNADRSNLNSNSKVFYSLLRDFNTKGNISP
jgi:hypothetical protein